MQHQEVTAIYIGLAALAAAFFFGLGYFLRKYHAKKKVKNAEDKAKKTIEASKAEAGSGLRGNSGLSPRTRTKETVGKSPDTHFLVRSSGLLERTAKGIALAERAERSSRTPA